MGKARLVLNVYLTWLCLVLPATGMSHKIDRSFKLIFWDVEIGELHVKVNVDTDMYTVTSLASARGLLSLFSRVTVSSGAIGKISTDGELIPIQSSTKWHSYGTARTTQLIFSDGELVKFLYSTGLKKDFHIENPTGFKDTIDPVSLLAWVLTKRPKFELCKGQLMVLDGFRLTKVYFLETKANVDEVRCRGLIQRISGFNKRELRKKPLPFELQYSKGSENKFSLDKVEVSSIFGNIVLYSQ